MIKKLRTILLIDDSEADNFIHCRRFNRMEIAEEVVIRNDGRQGLDYLHTKLPNGSFPRPDLLFLDINMPVMDGWQFLDEYSQLPVDRRAVVTVAMLTSSVGDADYSRAYGYPVVDAHEAKPLSKDKLRLLLQEYFPAHFADTPGH